MLRSALLHRRAERNIVELLLQEADMDAEAVFTSFRLTVAFYEWTSFPSS